MPHPWKALARALVCEWRDAVPGPASVREDGIWATIRLVSPLDILASRLPAGTVSTDAEILRGRAIDSWALALLRRVRGDELPVPAAVVFPACTEEVATVLAMREAGASGELGTRYGEHWRAHRNDAVQTYAQIMGPERAFGSGVIVDTVEVAGLWSAVPRLYQGIREVLAVGPEDPR